MKYSKIIKSVLFGGLIFFMMSCTDWLSVEDPDKTTEEQMFSSEENIQKALNGIYLTMASSDTYGRNMTYYTMELLAHMYNISAGNSTGPNSNRYYLTQHNYTEKKVKEHLKDLYLKQYNTILNINLFIKNIEPIGEIILPADKRDLMLGEAYALRAFIHLDLLRLFGPVYATSKTELSIPYYTKPDMQWQPLESAEVIMGKIQADIDHAAALLKYDPVRTEGVRVEEDEFGVKYGDNFWAHRNRRMNYYAVQALKVRALMYEGKKSEASTLAKSLITDTKFAKEFPWVTSPQVTSTDKPDRIASPEVLFGIENKDMYKDWEAFFSPGITSTVTIMAVSKTNTEFIYGTTWATSTDYRAKNWGVFMDASYITANKFKRSGAKFSNWYFQPLIRKAELYYVIAEADNDISYINQVRLNRGLKTFADAGTASPNITNELIYEFTREMYGEGQLFFHYKRLNRANIRNMSTGGNLAMTAAKYVIPIPDSEKNR